MAKAIGQPYHPTHPHILADGHITPGITQVEYRLRRHQFAQSLTPNTMVIFPAYPYQQNNNLLYLTGFDEPDAVLVIEKDRHGKMQERMFVTEDDDHTRLWSGPRNGLQMTIEHFGLQSVQVFYHDATKFENILVDNSENSCLSEPILKACNAKKTVGLLDRQRLYKSEAEVALMREAGRVGSEAFVETIKWSKGKTQESFLAAKMEFEAKLRAASGLAYVPVVAGGDRANIIHYVRNDRLIEPGQMVLMDAGAKVSGYCNDITRSWPISGKFSPAQREIYEAVLRVQKKCIQAVRRRRELSSNISISVLNQLSTVSFIDELDNLGFRNPESIVNQVFPHSVGHQIGLDLHDCQSISYEEPLRDGMAITIEPGLYIPTSDLYPNRFHGIGVRIEDDLILTGDGCENLTERVPREVAEIESLMS